uniref:NUDIX domain protein n=1 Tax=Megaviridae environmental sample TaxID=1737588 RepID=A0A5J6VK01_9VIRU|nr:MAG: NUDIX domain protein [Megaviridae environmental sample]
MHYTYCYNCGKDTHTNKQCPEPKISLGMICVNIENVNNLNFNFKYDINNFNYQNISNLKKISYYKDKIKFLLVQRRYSLNYIEFIRGVYDVNNIKNIKYILNLMSREEVNDIKNKSFETLWDELWKSTAKSNVFKKEYTNAKEKFYYLKKYNILDNIELTPWDNPEWEIPKGRREYKETNMDSAIREFNEETGLTSNDYNIFENIEEITDTFTGTNKKMYKHLYYLALANSTDNLSPELYQDNFEISNVKWFTWEEVINNIRPYYDNKIKIINSIFFFFINLIEKLNTVKIYN